MRQGYILSVVIAGALMFGGCGGQQNGETYIGADRASQLALDACGMTEAGVDSIATDFTSSNGRHCYQVDITAAGKSYHYEIDARTGVIVAMNSSAAAENSPADQAGAGQADQTAPDQADAGQTGQTTQGQTAPSGDTGHHPDEHHTGQAGAQAASGMITLEDAKAKALTHAGLTADQVTFVENKLDYENGRQVYELEFYTGDYKEYDYEIDAYTGEVVGYDYDAEYYTPSQSAGAGAITADEAKALALEKVLGAAAGDIKEFETDYDDGRTEYEGKIIYNGTEYEFEIDGSSGRFLKWEEEPAAFRR